MRRHIGRSDILIFRAHSILSKYRPTLLSFLTGFLVGRLINEFSNPAAQTIGDPFMAMLSVKGRPLNISTWILLAVIALLIIVPRITSRLVESRRYERILQLILQGLKSSLLAEYKDYIGVEDALTLQSCPNLHQGWKLSEVKLRHQTFEFTLPREYEEAYDKYFKELFHEKRFIDDKPKIMLRKNPRAFVDSPTLVLDTQLTRYSHVQFYRDMITNDPTLRDSLMTTLLAGDLQASFPHSLCLELVVVTKDERILITRRSPKVAYDPKKWSCSVAEQFAIEDVNEGSSDGAVSHWLQRFLKEELGLDTGDYNTANFRILSVFLESDIMNISLCGLVKLEVDHETLSAVINAKPRSDYEFTEHIFLKWSEVTEELVNPQRVYDATSRYKMLFALIHRYGEAAFIKQFLMKG